MNLFTQFWLSGGRHFGSGLLAGLTAGLPGEGPGGDILGLRGVPPGGQGGSPWGATRGRVPEEGSRGGSREVAGAGPPSREI